MKHTHKLAWMLFVSKRFARVDRKGRSALTSYLASLGIAFGVMTLIVVMAVMNGFQLGYIESILEISSYHARAKVKSLEAGTNFQELVNAHSMVTSISPFYEGQALVVGKNSRQQAAILRFVPPTIQHTDEGFSSHISLVQGSFDVENNTTVIGNALARSLGVSVGDTIHIVAMSGSSNTELFSDTRIFTISGIFTTDYSEINSSFMFFSLETGDALLGDNSLPFYGIKLKQSDLDNVFLGQIQNILEKTGQQDAVQLESWRSYNSAFFGALRVEKVLLLLVVCMIFIVVGVNIYNSMRRMVFERREEIAVFTALGSNSSSIQAIFIFRGFLIGFIGATIGLVLGLVISMHMDTVFVLMAKAIYYVQYFFVSVFNPENVYVITENPMFLYYAQIPTRIDIGETVFITLFGMLSALGASWIASKKILKLSPAEVLRYE